MKKKEQLYYLIKSLNKSEKRYFKLFSGFHSGSKVYTKLFDDIEKLEEPSYEDVHEKHVDKNNPGQGLTLKKRYLSEQILRSLRMYNEDRSVNMRIQNMLNDIEILYNKRLGTYCLRAIEKARQLAEQYERYGLLVQILDWERKLKFIVDESIRTEEEISIDEKNAISKKLNIFQLDQLFSKTLELKKKYGFMRGNQKLILKKEILNNSLLHDQKNCFSQHALFYFYYTNTLASWIDQNHLAAYQYSKKLTSINYTVLDKEDFLNGILEHTTSCVCLGYFDEVIYYLQFSEKFIESNPDIQHRQTRIRFFYYKANYSIISYNLTGNATMLLKTLLWAENEMNTNQELLTSEMKMVLLAGIFDGYFALNQIDHAWKYINEMVNSAKKNTRKDVYDGALITNILYWFESGEYELLKSTLLSANRYFKLNNADGKYTIELKLIAAFMQFTDFTSEKKRLQVFKTILTTLQHHVAQTNTENQFQETYQFYILYAESKIKEIPFHENAARWYKMHKKKSPPIK